MKITLVAAVAKNGVIGADGEMPWHYPEDLRQFKQTTMGHPVVMGRKTYESIEDRLGGPLPGRTNVVLSRRDSLDLPEGAVHARDLDAAFEAAEAALDPGQETIYVVGGATVYEACIDRADELLVTEIPETPAGDTYFPEIGAEWEECDRETTGELTVVTYRR
ncbi:dihydrofolate reductase [Natronomonas sp. LN261]|jgi:dihydrofolate reductase|uniref:dihydrofolate reductase n=1 Tax=Natronomonas sp. LN261 TaxID=2750669 RepID=UPI0015EF9900|nr:dihydrofolate reductase [Natronomonas sp. LN261]